MDVARYLRSVQDRISRGVRLALGEAGYETGEFVQKIVNITPFKTGRRRGCDIFALATPSDRFDVVP